MPAVGCEIPGLLVYGFTAPPPATCSIPASRSHVLRFGILQTLAMTVFIGSRDARNVAHKRLQSTNYSLGSQSCKSQACHCPIVQRRLTIQAFGLMSLYE